MQISIYDSVGVRDQTGYNDPGVLYGDTGVPYNGNPFVTVSLNLPSQTVVDSATVSESITIQNFLEPDAGFIRGVKIIG